ncbi:MAG: ScaI family restriction endonuclease [Thiotrichaceae bacterium]
MEKHYISSNCRTSLKSEQIVKIILEVWDWIFESKVGCFCIGQDIFPSPQIMSFLLHELIALKLAQDFPTLWKKGVASNEKDLVCLTNDRFSIEIKASSDKKHIFGNRSYAQPSSSNRKSKSGYYLTVNFQKFSHSSPHVKSEYPKIEMIRFGYIEHTDWIAQKASSGQQSRLPRSVYEHKLCILYQNIESKSLKK